MRVIDGRRVQTGKYGHVTVIALISDLFDSLHRRELDDTVAKLSTETGLAHHPSA